MSDVIWLIAESDKDVEIFRQILMQKQISVHVEKVGVGLVRGLPRLAHDLPKLIQLVRAHKRYRPNHCIVVLCDLDSETVNRTHHDTIRRICDREKLALLTADDKIEAWMLSDAGLCAFLNVQPRRCDEQPGIKAELESLLRRKRMTYSGRDRTIVIQKLNGSGDLFSPSMQSALNALQAAVCI